MKNIYKAKIVEIKPCAVESSGNIVDAFIKIRVRNTEFWCFVSEWKSKKWSLSFKDHIIPLEFVFLSLTEEKSSEKKKLITSVSDQKKPCDYVIFGKVVHKKTHPELPDKTEIIQLDCSVVVRMNVEKNKFKVGDYVRAEGRLDAHREMGGKK